jgi:uncharacterized membrane protein
MGKWKLLISSLPFVLVILAIKLILTQLVSFKGLIEMSEMGLILTGGIFLMGFMLAGTMTDYKESEKIPGDLATTFEAMEETLAIAIKSKQDLNHKEIMGSFFTLIKDVENWLMIKSAREEIYIKFDQFRSTLQILEQALVPPVFLKILTEYQNIRKLITRVNVISKTGFLATGYAMLEMLIALIFLLLMITTFKNLVAEIVIVFFVTLVYTYMYRLIKDVDDPFEYDESGVHGVTEIDLFPLQDYIKRASSRLKDN